MDLNAFAKKVLSIARQDGGLRAMRVGGNEALVKLLSLPFEDRVGVFNGVAVKTVPLFQNKDVYPHHKSHLVEATLEHASDGDMVSFVGGGRGVAPVRAARAGMTVTVYEAAGEMVELMEDTADINDVSISVIHAVVGTVYDAFGDETGAVSIRTGDMAGDLLVLDCEGAEQDILPAPGFDTVIVETHPQFGADTSSIKELMTGETLHWAETNHEGDYIIRK
jgi:hypothetical protein